MSARACAANVQAADAELGRVAEMLLQTEPASIQLRYLQTLTEIGVEKNTTVVFPIPIDLLSGIQKLTGQK